MENYQTDQSFQKQYEKYVKQVTPTHNLALQMLHAFVTGGAICTVGQIILNVAKSNGLDDAAAGSVCAILLVLASALLTGFNIYPSLVKWGGAGALVPITGFANSVAAPAIEFQKEGQVFGIGCKIFTIAGTGYFVWNFCQLGAWTDRMDRFAFIIFLRAGNQSAKCCG